MKMFRTAIISIILILLGFTLVVIYHEMENVIAIGMLFIAAGILIWLPEIHFKEMRKRPVVKKTTKKRKRK